MLDAIRKAVLFLDASQRRRWLLLVPLALFAAALEMVAALAILVLIARVGGAEAAALPVRTPFPGLDAVSVPTFGLLVALFFVAKNGARIFEIHARERVASDSVTAISNRLLRAYLSAPWSFHLRRNTASLIFNTRESADTVSRQILLPAAAAGSNALVAAGIAWVVIAAAPGAALVAGGAIGLVLVALFRLTQKRYSLWGQRAHGLQAAILRGLQQSLGGMKEIKVLGREAYFERAFDEKRRALSEVEVRSRTLHFVPRIAVESLFVCGVAAVIAVAWSRGATDLVAVLGLFAYAGLRILPALQEIVSRLNLIQLATAPLAAIHADWCELDRGRELRPPEDSEKLDFTERIVVDGVSYLYEGRDRPALDDVSFSIRQGESVGIVGGTGAGKSTLVDVLLGLLPPTAGSVTVDGRDIHAAPRGWQRQIGYVPQSVYLTDDTVRRNIALGLADDEIDDTRIAGAARTAQLAELLHELPAGLDTVVGERGVRLSGGQRQRIAVARALYHEPEVLVFDEATAALDNETEKELTREIESLQRKKTLVIIAHRLSTVRHCDRLILLREGRLAAIGPYDELLAGSEEFHRLAAEPDHGRARR